MSEISIVANLAVTIRILFLGVILFALPRLLRKGLLFGAYVGEEIARQDEARRLLRHWDRGCLLAMAVSLFVAWMISTSGWPVAGNLIGTSVFLLAALVLYIRLHRRALRLAPEEADRQARRAVASLEIDTSGGRLPKVALGVCVTAGLGSLVYAVVGYSAMPDLVPSLLGTGEWTDRSHVLCLFFPLLNLVVGPLYAVLALLTAGAKRSLRAGSGGGSGEAQQAFRAFVAKMFSGIALLFSALLSVVSVQIIRVGLGHAESLGVGVWLLTGVVMVFMISGLIAMMKRYGQGGALREHGTSEAPLTGGLADNAHWALGLFYFDRNDPSIMVEKRFGLGYSLNYGNRNALLFLITFVALLVAVTAFGVVGLVTGL